MILRAALFLMAIWAAPAWAEPLRMPSNAILAADEAARLDSYDIAIGPWTAEGTPILVAEGKLQRQVWQMRAVGLTTLQVIRPLRAQLRNDGYRVVFECADQRCGGFDFRFGLDLLAPPAMQVNLGDFRYLAAQKGSGDAQELIAIIASQLGQVSYVHVTSVGQDAAPVQATAPITQGETGPMDLEATLDALGHATLDDLAFETGSARLGPGPFASLATLGSYLQRYPTRAVALVGHTDSSGGLAANIRLSKRRAGSVLERLVTDYAVPRRQLEAQGMGYLAPVASNLTQEGRDANRRVEVIITTTQN